MKIEGLKGCDEKTGGLVKDDGKALTDFDLIELDEGRWYPEMWRDAWKS